MAADRNYFIFVVSTLDYGSHVLAPETIFDALTRRSLWLLAQHTVHRKRMSTGDQIVFYLAGNRRRHFVGDAVIDGEPRPLTRPEAEFVQEFGLSDFDSALDLTDIERWRSPVPIAPLYDDLVFIKDKRYPGHQLRQGVVRITGDDWQVIRRNRRD